MLPRSSVKIEAVWSAAQSPLCMGYTVEYCEQLFSSLFLAPDNFLKEIFKTKQDKAKQHVGLWWRRGAGA